MASKGRHAPHGNDETGGNGYQFSDWLSDNGGLVGFIIIGVAAVAFVVTVVQSLMA